MRDFNEESFFEAMMPVLREKRSLDPCPDAAVFSAVIEGTASNAVRDALLAHADGCPACAILRERLVSFEEPALPETEADWAETEGRLDEWFAEAIAEVRAVASPVTRQPAPWWKSIDQAVFSWKVAGGLVFATAALATVAVFMFVWRSVPPTHIARQAADDRNERAPIAAQKASDPEPNEKLALAKPPAATNPIRAPKPGVPDGSTTPASPAVLPKPAEDLHASTQAKLPSQTDRAFRTAANPPAEREPSAPALSASAGVSKTVPPREQAGVAYSRSVPAAGRAITGRDAASPPSWIACVPAGCGSGRRRDAPLDFAKCG